MGKLSLRKRHRHKGIGTRYASKKFRPPIPSFSPIEEIDEAYLTSSNDNSPNRAPFPCNTNDVEQTINVVEEKVMSEGSGEDRSKEEIAIRNGPDHDLEHQRLHIDQTTMKENHLDTRGLNTGHTAAHLVVGEKKGEHLSGDDLIHDNVALNKRRKIVTSRGKKIPSTLETKDKKGLKHELKRRCSLKTLVSSHHIAYNKFERSYDEPSGDIQKDFHYHHRKESIKIGMYEVTKLLH